MESLDLIKDWSTIPVGGVLAFLLWKVIGIMGNLMDNHMKHLQENTEIIKDGIKELHGSAEKTIIHLERQTDLLEKISNK